MVNPHSDYLEDAITTLESCGGIPYEGRLRYAMTQAIIALAVDLRAIKQSIARIEMAFPLQPLDKEIVPWAS